MLTGTKVTSAKAGANGVDMEAQTPDGKTVKLTAEYLLVATGRGPVTSGLGAEEAGLPMERGYIKVDKEFKTGVAHAVVPILAVPSDAMILDVGPKTVSHMADVLKEARFRR